MGFTMKKKLIFACLLLFTGYILFCPEDAIKAAADGLVLWYEKVLPTLLPFAILSNLLIYSNYLQYITRYLGPVIKVFLPVSENGAFVILSGFLFGFPMGSRNCAELLKDGKISKKEAEVLFIITNNISPVFISSYILHQQLALPELTMISLLILYLPPLLLGGVLLNASHIIPHQTAYGAHSADKSNHHFLRGVGCLPTDNERSIQKRPASGSQMNFKIIDTGIMNGFETLTRLGGYIMLFSILAHMIQKLPLPMLLRLFLTGVTEITNGIWLLSGTPLDRAMRYVLAMSFTAFGGLSGIAQTSSMIKDTGLSLKKYSITKLILTAVSTLLAVGAASWLSL